MIATPKILGERGYTDLTLRQQWVAEIPRAGRRMRIADSPKKRGFWVR